MNPPAPGTIDAVLAALATGLPRLLGQLALTGGLLVFGLAIYTAITPYRERALMRAGNMAGGIAAGGAIVALAIPLAALLATSGYTLDILVWGVIAVLIQLLTFAIVAGLLRDLRPMIESGNTAAATVVAAVQIAIGLLNAAAMVPN